MKTISLEIQKDTISVSEYLDLLNSDLKSHKARVLGEVCNLQLYEGRTYLYFSIKDKTDQSTIKCFMWKNSYDLSGVKLEDGLEIVVTGFPEIYKANGGMTLKAGMIEYVGDGVLRKAYEELKKKLDKEGLFSPDRKRKIPQFPNKIGVITSKDGAVINDFLTNIGKFGYKIKFINSRVEGQVALKELIGAIRTLKKEDIDVLVLMRGGGSLESFQAFNNEALIKEIADFPVPVITGIGHDKDIPLVSLVSDLNVSTPSIVASTLNKSWEQALDKVNAYQKQLLSSYQNFLHIKKMKIQRYYSTIKDGFGSIFYNFNKAKSLLQRSTLKISYRIKDLRAQLREYKNIFRKKFSDEIQLKHKKLNETWIKTISPGFDNMIAEQKLFINQSWNTLGPKLTAGINTTRKAIQNYEKDIKFNDPARQLKLGYSILFKEDKVIKTIEELDTGDVIEVQLSDGKVNSEIKSLIK